MRYSAHALPTSHGFGRMKHPLEWTGGCTPPTTIPPAHGSITVIVDRSGTAGEAASVVIAFASGS